MAIYGDVFFAVNLVVNGLILVMTGKVTGGVCLVWRIITAAVIGGLYSLADLLFGVPGPFSIAGKLLASIVLVGVAFGFMPLRRLCTRLACFYAISLLVGGAVLGWLNLADSEVLYSRPVWRQPAWSDLAAGCAVTVGLGGILFRRLALAASRRKLLLPVTIVYQDRTVALTALVDTGNNLRSLAGQPVIVAEQAGVAKLLPPEVLDYLQNTPAESWLGDLARCSDAQWLARLEIIPYRGVGSQSLLLGFRPDGVVVGNSAEAAVSQRVIIGLYQGMLSVDGSYTALLHPAVAGGDQGREETKKCV